LRNVCGSESLLLLNDVSSPLMLATKAFPPRGRSFHLTVKLDSERSRGTNGGERMRALYVMGIVAIAASLQVAVLATPVAAPEIDPNSAVSALGLLTGGIMILRARFGR
jgi:hypothetical protein